MDKLQKIQELRTKQLEDKNPALRIQRMLTESLQAKAIDKLNLYKGEKGDDGHTPTSNELISLIRPLIPSPIIPLNGKDGAEGKMGPRGETPVRLVDYWTRADQESIVNTVLGKIIIPQPKDGVSPSMEDIVSEVKKTDEIKEVGELIKFLKLGGFRGGGSSGTGSSISLTTIGTSGPATLVGTVLNIPQYITPPAGLNLQLQYNNGGVFGGITGATTNGTIVSLTNPLIGGATITTSTVNGVTLTTGGGTTTFLNADGTYSTPAGAGTVTSVASADGSITVTNPTSTVDLAIVKAPKLTTARNIAITGDLAWNVNFDGSGNVTATGTLASVITAGGPTGSSTVAPIITWDAKGRLTTVTSATVTPAVGSITGLGTGIATFLVTPSSANLASAVTDETGSGALVFGTAPTITLATASTAVTQTPGDSSTKVATTAYVDAAVQGTDAKDACKYASTAVLPSIIYANGSSGVGATLTGVALAAISLDSSSPSVGDRVLIKNQASSFQNGIYSVTATGSGIAVFVLTRTSDFDQAADIDIGDSVFITAGTVNTNTTWVQNGTNSPVMGTDPITFSQIAGPGSITSGNGITITGLSVAINTAVTVDLNTSQTLTNKILTSPTFTTPVLGTPSSGTGTNITGIPAANILAGTFGTGAYTMDTSLKVPQMFNTENAQTASANAITFTRANRINKVTNNSAAGLTITLSTSGAAAGDILIIKAVPSTAVAQAITWVNTENSTVTPNANLNASTTSPTTDGFMWNSLTSKWRCVASC